jgi:hypothetical protein
VAPPPLPMDPAAPLPQYFQGPAPARSRPSQKSKDKYMERDFLVDCILNDEPLKRASTPRGTRYHDGRSTPGMYDGRSTPRASTPRAGTPRAGTPRCATPRSSSRGPSAVRGSRSHSRDVQLGGANYPNPASLRPQKSLAGKPPPHVLDFLHFDEAVGRSKGNKLSNLEDSLGSGDSSMSSLPQLPEKRPSQRKVMAMAQHGSKATRSWRENAVSLYA